MNRTDPYAPVDPAKGWGPALFRSFSTHDTRNISGKQKEERSVPSSPAASGWSPSLFRSSSCLDNRAERGRGLKAETDESDTAAQKSSGWSLFGSMTKLDVNRSNHGKDNTKKDAPRVRAGWPNFGSLANLGNANTLATERDSIKEASAARANELLLDFGNRSQSTSQLDSVRPTKTRATNRTSNSISRPMQLEIYEVPTCKAAPSATIKNIESNFLFGQVKQQSVALSDAETEAIQREIQQEQEKKNRRNAVIERNRMQSSNDRNALFTRMQEHKQKMREGGEEALVPQTGDKEIDVSPNTEEANATLLNDEYEEKKQDHSEHSRENQESDIGFPHEKEEEECLGLEDPLDNYLRNDAFRGSQAQTVVCEKDERIDEIIELKLQLANQQELNDSLSSKLQHMEVTHCLQLNTQLAKITKLETNNLVLKKNLIESYERELKLRKELNYQQIDHDQELGKIDKKNNTLERNNFELQCELSILRNSLQSSCWKEKGEGSIYSKSITTNTTAMVTADEYDEI
mmetsp:Transcript_1855/g.3825  ORF Transcript_1855/g.3825 Transcript_1855/m.3825 type:complete len:519 (-) Transcript_1855:116-1672(-)